MRVRTGKTPVKTQTQSILNDRNSPPSRSSSTDVESARDRRVVLFQDRMAGAESEDESVLIGESYGPANTDSRTGERRFVIIIL